jgi:hypothetical protein
VTTPAADWVRRFAVEHREVRGELVRLGPAWLALREHADYPPPVRRLLGEAVAAVVLLASTLKFEGELTLQMQGDGAVRLLVAQCTHDLRIRAVARFDAARLADDFATLAGTGSIVVTIESDRMQSRYQGIVPIDGASLAATLETTPRELRKFLRSIDAGVGKGSRYSLDLNARSTAAMRKQFDAWRDARAAKVIDDATPAPEGDDAPDA